MVDTTGSAVKARQRAREQRLAKARERRLRLDPERLAREERIDGTTADVEEARERLSEAQDAVDAAEHSIAVGLGQLVAEKLTVGEVAELTGLDERTVRRLRRLKSRSEPVAAE